MRYVRAREVIPEKLLKQIQEYVDGEYLYIPRKETEKRCWGEKSRAREEIDRRNVEIYRQSLDGLTVRELAARYYLSEKSIGRILSEQKKRAKADAGRV